MKTEILNVFPEDIMYQIKISCQIPNLLKAIAIRKIISDTASEAGIIIELEELQESADSLRLANNLIKAEDTWNWLNKHHLSLDNFEEIAQMSLLSTKLAEHLFKDKVESFFYAHQLDYTGAVIYEVILDDEDLALELFYALQEGEISFQEIARQHITDPELRRAGGYQGIRLRNDFTAEIAAPVFAAHPPQIIKPIMTSRGIHLIMVEEIIKPELTEEMRQKILGELFNNWLEQQLSSSVVVAKFVENLPDKYNSEILSQAS